MNSSVTVMRYLGFNYFALIVCFNYVPSERCTPIIKTTVTSTLYGGLHLSPLNNQPINHNFLVAFIKSLIKTPIVNAESLQIIFLSV